MAPHSSRSVKALVALVVAVSLRAAGCSGSVQESHTSPETDSARAQQSADQPAQSPASGEDQAAPVTVNPQPAAGGVTPPATAKPTCSVQVTVKNQLAGQQAASFAAAYPDIAAILRQAVSDDCPFLFAKATDVPTGTKQIALTVTADPTTIAFVSGSNMTISGQYFIDTPGDGPGVLHHETVHLYQNNRANFPGWAIEGHADYVRYRTGFVSISQRSKGGNYDDAYNTTAFFFDYLETKHAGIMFDMLQAMNATFPYSAAWFVQKTGQNLDQLWAAYQQTL